MKQSRLVTPIALGLLLLGSPIQARTWTSADGRSLEADLVEYDASAGTVRIKRKDGKVFTLKKESLSPQDIAHLDEIEKEEEAARQAAKAKAEALAGKTSSHASTGEYKAPFHVYYPKSYDGSRKLPLLILFSPGGSGKGILNSFKEPADKMEWVLVGCDKFKNGMDEVMADAMFNGNGDKAANSWIERDTDVLKKFRCKVKSFEFPGGHAVAPPEVLLEAMQWIKTEPK